MKKKNKTEIFTATTKNELFTKDFIVRTVFDLIENKPKVSLAFG